MNPRYLLLSPHVALISMVVSILACASQPTITSDRGLFRADSIVLDRSRCFGMCPAYRLSVDHTGRVTFQSHDLQPAPIEVGAITSEAFHFLESEVDRSAFASFPAELTGSEYCRHAWTDMPTATVEIFGAQPKRVVDYQGCHSEDSAIEARLTALRAFEATIDSVTGSSRWIASGRRR